MDDSVTDEEAPTVAPAEPSQRLRVRQGALISAVSALLLLVVMFATKWYGVDEIPGRVATRTQVSHAINAWQALSIVRWLMLATIAVAVGSVLLHGSQRSHGSKTNTGPLVAALGAITALVLIYRVLIDLPSHSSVVDQKLGAIIGLVAALGIALGGYESTLEARDRARRGAHSSRSARQVTTGQANPMQVTPGQVTPGQPER